MNLGRERCQCRCSHALTYWVHTPSVQACWTHWHRRTRHFSDKSPAGPPRNSYRQDAGSLEGVFRLVSGEFHVARWAPVPVLKVRPGRRHNGLSFRWFSTEKEKQEHARKQAKPSQVSAHVALVLVLMFVICLVACLFVCFFALLSSLLLGLFGLAWHQPPAQPIQLAGLPPDVSFSSS